MSKRIFIKIKRGILSPKHYNAIGPALWLFLYIIDRTDWNDGLFKGYTDAEAAEVLEVPKRTIRSWRIRLEDGEYIACRQSLHSQTIYVNNWSNPKEKWIEEIDKIIEQKELPFESWSGPMIQALVTDISGIFINIDINRLGNIKKALVKFGKDEVKNALSLSLDGWKNQKRKDNGQTYSIYNQGWIDWAIEFLITGSKKWEAAEHKTTLEMLAEGGYK